ncbi:MAG: NADP-dependent oxidoreductase [Microlunatus sp.]|nr:NADP-dependent oxidoreductase [Microlunatus sp.]
MRAVRIHGYGDAENLVVEDVTEPRAGSGEIRIAVTAASVNRIDAKILRGSMAGGEHLAEPTGLGFDAAGVVDEIGAGVTGVEVGDDVFGLGRQTQAEYAVLTSWTAKPASVDWAVAGAAGTVAETAIRVLDLLGIGTGSTVLVDGASGGVGSVTVQIATARGATVVATASAANQDYLREIGAIPVVYGDGMPKRVRDSGMGALDGVVDVAGKTSIEHLTGLVDDPAQVVSIANFGAEEAGARVTTGGEGDPFAALAEAARMLERSELVIKVQTFDLGRVQEAYEIIETGHTRGKLVLLP